MKYYIVAGSANQARELVVTMGLSFANTTIVFDSYQLAGLRYNDNLILFYGSWRDRPDIIQISARIKQCKLNYKAIEDRAF